MAFRDLLQPGAMMLLLTGYASASDLTVTDGDGLRICDEHIRLWGIDAPELAQTCKRDGNGEAARAALENLLHSGDPACEPVEGDRYGRTVARCAVNGRDLGAEMVRRGWAVDYKRYSGGAYADEERDAREAARGLWAGEFEIPALWRKAQ